MALPATTAAYLQRMQLNSSDDALLFSKIQAWVHQHKASSATSVEVSCTSLVLQRLARAFACRTTVTPPDNSVAPGTTTPVTTIATAATSPQEHPHGASPETTLPSSPAAAVAAATNTPPATAAASPSTTLPDNHNSKTPIRSAKKLDLSPPVAHALKKISSDMAYTLPLLLENNGDADLVVPLSVSNAAPKITVVDVFQRCLDLLAKPMPIAVVENGTTASYPGNGAMALYRTVLLGVFERSHSCPAASISANTSPAASVASAESVAMTLDEVKFKTFCTKALESAMSQTLSLVEAFYDFQFVWDICQYEHALKFPTASKKDSPEQLRVWQQHRAWQLACYLVWKWQEASPDVCTRRQRLLAAVTSLTLNAVLSVLSSSSKDDADSDTEDATGKRAREGPITVSQPAGSTTTETGGENGLDGNAAKRPRILGPTAASPVAAPQPIIPSSREAVLEPNTKDNGQSLDQERRKQHRLSPAYENVVRAVLLAAKQACSFLTWSAMYDAQTDSNKIVESDISREELETQLDKVASEMIALSSRHSGGTESSWADMLQFALGGAKGEQAELSFFGLMEKMLQVMRLDDSQRKGTRVETVAYVRDGSLTTALHLMQYLCPVVRGRRKVNAFELVALAPGGTVTPWKLSPKSAHKPLNPRSVLSEEADSIHNAIMHNSGAAAPPVITEAMELNEWTIAILASLSQIRPSSGLVTKLDATSPQWRDVVINVVNRFLSRLHHAGIGAGSPPVTVNSLGELVTATISRTQDTQFCAVCVAFYYHALEAMLYAESDRLETSKHPKLVLSQSFHRALLTCCYTAVLKAVTNTGKIQLFHHAQQPEQSLDLFSILHITESTPYNYLKVTDSFLRALTLNESEGDSSSKTLGQGSSPLSFAFLPRVLQKEIRSSEVQAIESLIWAGDAGRGLKDSCLLGVIAELTRSDSMGRKKSWPPDCLDPSLPEELEDESRHAAMSATNQQYHAEFVFVSFIMRKLLKTAHVRIQAMCQVLKLPDPIPTQVWLTYRFILRHHVNVLYDRHIDQLIVCTIYGICKVMKYRPDLTFARLIDVYVSVRGKELGERACQAIVRNVKVADGRLGNVIELYNLVFVPTLKNYLLQSKPLRRNAVLLKQAMAEKGLVKGATGTTTNAGASCATNNSLVSMKVCEGNVSLRLTRGSASTASSKAWGANTVAKGSTVVVPGLALPDSDPEYRTLLQFGQASKNLSLTNEMVTQATVPFSH